MPKRVDLSGQKRGLLTVRQLNPTGMWECQCECGTVFEASAKSLNSGGRSHCGCAPQYSNHRLIDLTDKEFGQLRVIDRVENSTKNQRPAWRCLCRCGNEVVVQGHRLREGHTKSCGCLRSEVMKVAQRGWVERRLAARTDEEAAIAHRFSQYKQGAKRRHFEFCLTEKEFGDLLKQPCHYCGAEPCPTKAPKRPKRTESLLGGLDRVDSKKGYVLDNVVSCCTKCNQSKSDKSKDEFLAHCNRIVAHQRGSQ